MNDKDPTTNVPISTAGAVFHQCALHVNPYHYSNTFRGQETEGDAQSHAEAIVAKAAEIGVSVLAITDHNNVSGVAAFREAAKNRGITIFSRFSNFPLLKAFTFFASTHPTPPKSNLADTSVNLVSTTQHRLQICQTNLSRKSWQISKNREASLLPHT